MMCCMSYEVDAYQEMKKNMPKVGSFLKTKDGEGNVVGINVILSKVMLETKDGKKIEVSV